MRGMGQWASRPESWGPNGDPPRQKKKRSRFRYFPETELKFGSSFAIEKMLEKIKGDFEDILKKLRNNFKDLLSTPEELLLHKTPPISTPLQLHYQNLVQSCSLITKTRIWRWSNSDLAKFVTRYREWLSQCRRMASINRTTIIVHQGRLIK